MNPRKLPIGVQSFEDLRANSYVYVDKTEHVWRLVETGKAYFLSRPRRFGKSLLLSTLEAYFRGQRELFDGLAIQSLEDARGEAAWAEHPVVRFSLSGGEYGAEGGLEDALGNVVGNTARRYEVEDDPGQMLSTRFYNLIERLHRKTGRQAVVLVDEYDKPLLAAMDDPAQEERNRRLYKAFFSVLKDQDQHLRFVFFTGVTKFSKVSVFSDLNQLNDVSLDDGFAGVCGITEDELVRDFGPEIDATARAQGQSRDECLAELARMYDGYRFSKDGAGVYNPFSLLSAFYKRELERFWFETGTPTFLIRKLRMSGFTAEDFSDGVTAAEGQLKDYRPDSPNPVPLFYQAGYLTIAGYDREYRAYRLRFPNDEVRYGFLESLVPYVLGDGEAERSPLTARQMVMALRRGDVASLMERLAALFSSIPYVEGLPRSYEAEWRNEVFLVFSLMGQYVRSEVHTAAGRADCVVETRDYVYLFEFKLDKGADEALRQIDERGYALPYVADKRRIYKVGVAFSSQARTIAEWRLG